MCEFLLLDLYCRFEKKFTIKYFDLSSSNNTVLQTYFVQHLTDERDNFKANNALWLPFMPDLNDCQGDQKKYKVSFWID